MTHIFPCEFVGQTTRIGCRRLTFEVPDEAKDMSKEIGNSSQGTKLLIVAYEIGEDSQLLDRIHKGDTHEQRNLLLKQLHAIVGDYSQQTGVNERTIKRLLKITLKKAKLLESSLSELDEYGLASGIYVLKTTLSPSRFDYSEYVNDTSDSAE